MEAISACDEQWRGLAYLAKIKSKNHNKNLRSKDLPREYHRDGGACEDQDFCQSLSELAFWMEMEPMRSIQSPLPDTVADFIGNMSNNISQARSAVKNQIPEISRSGSPPN